MKIVLKEPCAPFLLPVESSHQEQKALEGKDMWTSKGRSGYGDSTIGGDYDSWYAVSPNGKQYKNEATMETRDLSGADYWHLRKQNRPTEAIPAHLHMLNKDRANIEAYADPVEAPKRKTSVPLKSRILPQFARLEKLTAEIIELEQAYRKGEFTPAEYTLLRSVAFKKRDRAQVLLNKAISAPNTPENIDESEEFGVEYATQKSVTDVDCGVSCGVAWVDELSAKNTFKKVLQNTCKASRTLVKWCQRAKAYYQTLKEV